MDVLKLAAIRETLVEKGRARFENPVAGPAILSNLSNHPGGDALLNDLERFPHAFVLGCLMDRQVRYEKAWIIPFRMSERLGGFSIRELHQCSLERVTAAMSNPTKLHRFVETMSGIFHSAVDKIATTYQGDASRIWKGEPSSAETVLRFLEFKGAGPKIATMAVNILAHRFRVKFSDYTSVDVSADVHVRRVFTRLGLCANNPTVDQVVYTARVLHPSFPGIVDLPCWEIGKDWCRPTKPKCGDCYMNRLCPSAK